MKKYIILSNHEIGKKVSQWAIENEPFDFKQTNNLNEADVIFSVFSKKILKPEELKGKLSYNFHAGKLPDYKGSCTLNWAIINGEEETAITLHEMVAEIDAGRIVEEYPFVINETDTAETLFEKANDVVFLLFKKHFLKMLRGKCKLTAQPKREGKMYFKRDLDNVKDITNLIRGLTFRGKEGVYFIKDGIKITINY